MTTSDKIAGPLDGGKKKPGPKPKPKTPPTIPEIKDQKIEDIETIKKEVGLRSDGLKSNNAVFEESNWSEIDWNKVQVIEDIKVILEKLGLKFDSKTIQSGEPISRYLID
jgi:hypothetical protein